MSQLRRMFLSNVGYRSAYYSGVLLNFCNKETDQPENTVIWLANQGGKTTLISLLFTNIDPDQRRFVQHLQKQDHHFSDYFYPTPGVVALELQVGGSDLIGAVPLIIGQCVVVKDNGQTQRVFFGFDAHDPITLDSLPFKGAGQNYNPRSIGDFKAWLESAQKQNSTVYITESQHDWKFWLDSKGVEHELLAKQIDFCRSEGGISEFASFKSERVFLEQFFRLALDEKICTHAHQTLQDAHDQFKDMPILEEQRLIYEELLKGFEGIKPHADQYLQYSKKLEDQDNQIVLFVQQIQVRQQWLNNEVEALNQKVTEIEESIKSKQNFLDKTKLHLKRISLTRYSLELDKAKNTLKKEEQQLELAQEQLVLIKAVIAYEEMKALQTKVRILKKNINAANEDIEPLEKSLKKIGSQLKATYQSKIDKLRKNIEKIEKHILEINNDISIHEGNIEKWEAEAKKEENTVSRAAQWFDSYELKHASLRNNEHLVIVDGEELNINKTKVYWENEFQVLNAELDKLNSLKENKSEEKKQVRAEKATLSTKITILETELSHLETDRTKASEKRRDLEKDPWLCKLIQMDHVNPDDQSLLEKLNHSISKLHKAIQKQQQDINNLDIQKRWLEKDRLQKPDNNIERALEWLDKRGIEASYYPHYLGKQQLSATQTKALVESDPARFYGIQVNNISTVRSITDEINREDLGLSQPVVISESCNKIETQQGNVVLPVRNDAAYNEDAARDLLHSINQKLDNLEAQLTHDQDQYSDLTPVEEKLKAYQSIYGKEWFNKQEYQINQKNIEKEKNKKEQEKIKHTIETISQLLIETEGKLNDARENKSAAKQHLTFIDEFITDFETQKVSKITEKKVAQASIKTLGIESKQAFELIQSLTIELDKEKTNKKNYKSRVDSDTSLLSNITHQDNDSELSPINLADLSQLQSQYNAGVQSYKALVNTNKLAELKGELGVFEKDLKVKQRKYLEVKQSYTEAEIENKYSLVQNNGQDLPYLEQQQIKKVEAHISTKGGYQAEHKNAQKALSTFQQSHPDILELEETLSLPELDDLQQQEKINKKDHEESIVKLIQTSSSITDKGKSYKNESSKIKIGLQSVPDNFLQNHTGSEDINSVEETNSEEVIDQISRLFKEKSTVRTSQKRTENKVDSVFRSHILPIVQDTKQLKLIGAKAIDIRDLLTNQLITRAEPHILSIQDALDAVNSIIKTNNDKLELFNSSFNRLLDDADDALHAAFKVRIPSDMLQYSDKHILRSGLSSKDKLSTTLSTEQRTSLYSSHLNKIIEEQSVDEDGFKLAASFLLEAYKLVLPVEKIKKRTDILNICIIKPQDFEIEYISVNKMVGSGGEGLTAGLLLYLVIAKIRGDRMGQGSIGTMGSFLLLDNPFSKANKIDLIRPQTQLAKKLNIQLIFATGIEDLNAIGEFEHIIRLRKDRMDTHSKRQYIEHEEQGNNASNDYIEDLNKYQIESADYSFNRSENVDGTEGTNESE